VTILVIAILAVSLAYYYVQTSNEISSLKSAGQILCRLEEGMYNPVVFLIANETNTLQQQMQSDNAIIASLNSTRPSGYAAMVATLGDEVKQDAYMLTLVNNLELASSSLSALGPSPCTVLTG
jgi:hypothetical protein